jgi:hypothetical protein
MLAGSLLLLSGLRIQRAESAVHGVSADLVFRLLLLFLPAGLLASFWQP